MRARHRRARRIVVACGAVAFFLAPATVSPRTPPDPAAPPAQASPRHRAERETHKREEDYEAPVPAWREGPVRYLLSMNEDDAYRALTTDAERARFIARFWASRDPLPATPENEYRTQFYRRVAEANRLLIGPPVAGWKTDRGKIYILLGPPDEQERIGDPQSASETIVWTYRSPPKGSGIGARSAIRFVKDPTGDYRLSTTAFHEHLETSLFETSLGVGFQVQAMQMMSLPEPRRLLDTIVTSRSFLDASPFRTHRDFFRAADGNTFTILTVGVRQSLVTVGLPGGTPMEPEPGGGGEAAPAAFAPPLRFEVMARLNGEAAGLPTYELAGPNGLRAAPEDADCEPGDYLLFQGGTTVKPGHYTVYYGIVDRESQELYSFKEVVVVPDLRGEGLELSSVTLASRLERVADGSAHGYTTPFVLGNLRVLPRPDDVFRNGETFAFYFQIYDPAIDPIDGRPDLDVEYQFFEARRTDDTSAPSFAPLGRPIRLTRQQDQVQGYSFALKDWPAATYRLRVLVTDNLNGRQSSREVTFRIL